MKNDYGKSNEKNLKLIIAITRAMKEIAIRIQPEIENSGLTPSQFGVLEALYHKGPLTVNQIIEKTLSSSGNMGVVIDNLIKAGFAEKNKDSDDRRVRLVTITEQGMKLMSELFPNHLITLSDTFKVLNEDEKDELTRILRKLSKHQAEGY